MVVWFSLKIDTHNKKEYTFEELKELLADLLLFHAKELNCYVANAGNKILIDTDRLKEDFNWRLSLLKEQFDLMRQRYSSKIHLSQILTITSFDPHIEDSYSHADDPKGTKKRIAERHFNLLKQQHPEFNNFILRYNYEY